MRPISSVLIFILLLLVVLGLFGGCTTEEIRIPVYIPMKENIQDAETKQPVTNDNLEKLASILRYEQVIHGLETEELELERDLLETSMDTATDIVLIKLSLLYGHKNSSFYNVAHAKSLLQSCLDNNAGSATEVASLSYLITELFIQIIDQQKYLNFMQAELDKERSQRKILNEKLNALKAIEESINDRSNKLSESIRQ